MHFGDSAHVGAPAQEDVRNAIFCSVAEESPIKVSFGLWCLWHACLQPCSPSPNHLQHRMPKGLAVPREWLCALP